MKVSFESCALRFLDQWFLQEKPLFDGLREGSNEAKLNTLKKAATYFSIARNFPARFDDGRGLRRFEPVVDILDNTKDPMGASVNAVDSLQKSLSAIYGGRKLISAASKLLWLKYRDGVIIYDLKARETLGLKKDDYRVYCSAWKNAYTEHQGLIRNVCATLTKAQGFALCGVEVSSDEIKKATTSQWFYERVLDTYLWFSAD